MTNVVTLCNHHKFTTCNLSIYLRGLTPQNRMDGLELLEFDEYQQQYGRPLEKLIHLPWRSAYIEEFQTKVYYNAGLRELAKSYRFQSVTLQSLESCSNFKRTHLFLLQVWEAMYRAMVLHHPDNVRIIFQQLH